MGPVTSSPYKTPATRPQRRTSVSNHSQKAAPSAAHMSHYRKAMCRLRAHSLQYPHDFTTPSGKILSHLQIYGQTWDLSGQNLASCSIGKLSADFTPLLFLYYILYILPIYILVLSQLFTLSIDLSNLMCKKRYQNPVETRCYDFRSNQCVCTAFFDDFNTNRHDSAPSYRDLNEIPDFEIPANRDYFSGKNQIFPDSLARFIAKSGSIGNPVQIPYRNSRLSMRPRFARWNPISRYSS